MPDSAPAIFLSYASQDADVAQRMCDSLRAAGIEVWFDKSELVGGDQWDQKIRGQVKACALFVPVISAATQARLEGYFRLEWKLAAQRTHTMADEKTFLLPVVIDGTRDADAKVPDEFRAVQWTRLAGGETTPAFVARVKTLLGGSAGAQAAPPVGASVDDARGRGPATPLQRKRSPLALTAGAFAIVVAIATALFVSKKSIRPAAAPSPVAAAPAPVVARSAPAPTVDEKSIAVLPFVNRSAEKENEFFTDGIHEDILTSLTNIRDLHVVSRTSVMEYRGTTKKIPQIARELGVAFVLEGSVQRSGNAVRITGQLIRAATDQHVWAKNFDRELTAANVFAIQTELAQAIAGELKAVLSPQEQKLIARLPTASLDAYDLYLKARELRDRINTNESTAETVRLLERSVAIDPQFGLAWAKLAWARAYLYVRSINTRKELLPQVREALVQAEKLLPGAPELFLARGYSLYFGENDFPRALEEFQQARELAPNFAEPFYAMASVQRRQGRWREALAGFQAAVRIEPSNPEYLQELGVLLVAGRRYAEADEPLRRAGTLGRTGSSLLDITAALNLHFRGELSKVSLSPDLGRSTKRLFEMLRGELPANGSATSVALDRAIVLSARGEASAARAELEEPIKQLRQQLERDDPMATIFGWSDLAKMEALRGNRDEALRCARKFLEVPVISREAWRGANYCVTLAFVHTWTGDKAAACDEVARLLRAPVYPYYALNNVYVLRLHPAFAPLRGFPQFEALLNDPKNNAPLF